MAVCVRHELKHIIDYADCMELRRRLQFAAKRDVHANQHGTYLVRSLYFDTPNDTAYQEKIDGVDPRNKFRIRYYDDQLDVIRLEKKSKVRGLCLKQSAPLSFEQCERMLAGQWQWLKTAQHPLLQEFYVRLTVNLLRPKSIVVYRREAFVYPVGNVRITIDSDLRQGRSIHQFLNPDASTIPLPSHEFVLEVKYDSFFPQFLCDFVRVNNRQTSAFSKYALSRTM